MPDRGGGAAPARYGGLAGGVPPSGLSAVHHSPAYREAYDPHYRVLRTAYGGYFPALLAAAGWRGAADQPVVAIDGPLRQRQERPGRPDGAAPSLQRGPHGRLLSPSGPPGRELGADPGWKYGLARFLQEVLVPAGAGAQIRCRPYDCRSGTLREGTTLPARPLTVVEGSYSQLPLLSARYDLRMFLTCAPEEQRRRLERREGAHFAAYESRWMPLEERYIRQCGPEKGCQLVIDTTEFFP